jgi:hypothetical protein
MEKLFFNKHLFARGLSDCQVPDGPKGRQQTSGQGAAAEGRTQAARVTKYIEVHGGVRLPHEYLPAHGLHILRSVPWEERQRLLQGELSLSVP